MFTVHYSPSSWFYSENQRIAFTFFLVKQNGGGGGVMNLVYGSLFSFFMAFLVFFSDECYQFR